MFDTSIKKTMNVPDAAHWEKFNEAQPSYGMSANGSRPREPADKAKSEEELQKATKQNTHVEKPKEEENQQDEPRLMFESEAEGSDDLETGEGETGDKIIPQ